MSAFNPPPGVRLPTPDAAPSSPVTLHIPDTCGRCEFTEPMANDLTQVICGGAPPIPVATPQGLLTIRPSLPRMQKACALFRLKPELQH